MILMHTFFLQLEAFNERDFGIFNEEDQIELLKLWDESNRDIKKFIALLSPEQEHRVAAWATERILYPVDDLIKGLKKFTKYLQSSSYRKYTIYPKHKQQSQSAAKTQNTK